MAELFDSTLEQFAGRLGLASLPRGRDGGAELAIEQIGRLQMELADGQVLVTLARPYPSHAEKTARAALALCHWRENHPWPVHAGARGAEWLSFTARLPEGEFDLPALERLVGELSRLLDAAERAG